MELQNGPAGNFRFAQFVDHVRSLFSWENAVRWRFNLKIRNLILKHISFSDIKVDEYLAGVNKVNQLFELLHRSRFDGFNGDAVFDGLAREFG